MQNIYYETSEGKRINLIDYAEHRREVAYSDLVVDTFDYDTLTIDEVVEPFYANQMNLTIYTDDYIDWTTFEASSGDVDTTEYDLFEFTSIQSSGDNAYCKIIVEHLLSDDETITLDSDNVGEIIDLSDVLSISFTQFHNVSVIKYKLGEMLTIFSKRVDKCNQHPPTVDVSRYSKVFIRERAIENPYIAKEAAVIHYSISSHSPYCMLTDTSLLDNKWEYKTIGTNYPKLNKLTKPIVSPTFKIRVTGSTEDAMLYHLEELVTAFDRDCMLEEKGRLYIGDYYRECFIIENVKEKVFRRHATTVEFVAVTDTPWIKDNTYIFTGNNQQVTQISSTLVPSASHRQEYIVYSPNVDGTTTIDWDPQASPQTDWFMLDFGRLTTVDTISGIKVIAGTMSCSPSLQYSTGSTQTSTSSVSSTIETETNKIKVKENIDIKVTSYSGSQAIRGGSITMFLYKDGQEPIAITIELDKFYDVRDYDYVSFLVGGGPSQTVTVYYTLKSYLWSNLQSIASFTNQTKTFDTVSNITLRYLRVWSSSRVGNLSTSEFSVELPDDAVYSDIINNPRPEMITVNGTLTRGTTPSDYYYFYIDSSKPYNTYIYMPTIKNVRVKKVHSAYSDPDRGSVNGQLYLNGLTSETSRVPGEYIDEDTWERITNLSDHDTHTVSDPYIYKELMLELRKAPGLQPTATVRAHLLKLEIFVEFENKLTNESYGPCEAVISITGPTSQPQVMIGDVSYGASLTLTDGHTLKVDTENQTVMNYDENEGYENAFSNRVESTFEKVESGEHDVTWYGDIKQIEVKLKQIRSEPKWS